jgi:predicted SAM-dependent methyltransferase
MKSHFRLLFSRRTRAGLKFDRLRLIARLRSGWKIKSAPDHPRLHLGCGRRRIPGWLNVDVAGSEFDVDLAAPLPWVDRSFDAVVSQQVIEHLDIESEVMPLFAELFRVTRPGAEIWLSCPDMAKVCAGYLADGGATLLADRRSRVEVNLPAGMPPSQMVNIMFHQGNEHKNLYDFPLLKWLLESRGFGPVTRVSEGELRTRFPEFPPRNDDFHGLYVRAARP